MDYKNKPIGGSLRHNYSLCGLTGEGMAGIGFFTRARWEEQDFIKRFARWQEQDFLQDLLDGRMGT
jgi:hypothetical protein